MATIEIEQLEILALVGVYLEERKKAQPLYIDLQLEADITDAAKSDDLEQTVDYAQVVKSVEKLVQSQHFFLIESIAEQILELLIREYQLQYAKVKVTKPQAIKQAKSVSVTAETGEPAWLRKLQP